jgi:hypothetical protein
MDLGERPDLNPGVFTVLPEDICFLSGEDFDENFSIELACWDFPTIYLLPLLE